MTGAAALVNAISLTPGSQPSKKRAAPMRRTDFVNAKDIRILYTLADSPAIPANTL